MTSTEAKQILQLARPSDLAANPGQFEEAMRTMRATPELRAWFEQHSRTEEAIREKFQSIPVPADLKNRLLENRKIVRPQFSWRRAQWLQLAACILILLGGALWLVIHSKTSASPRFADYQSRMVRSALREYKMEVLTKDMGQLRRWMQSRRAPADFDVPKGLAKLTLTGGGVLHWNSTPVSMVCFNRGDNKMLFLFVMNKEAVNDPPTPVPQLDQVKKLATVSWTEGNQTYLLAGPPEPDSLRKYL
jgi:hypothetical protein